ncbi:MAG: hypothetical protein ACKOFZ_02210 [Ilumatobacteraceae bacterium]
MGDIVVKSEFFLATFFVLDDEGIVESEVVDVLPMFLKLGPNSRTQVVLHLVVQDRTQITNRHLVTWYWIIGMGRESSTRFGCSNHGGAKPLGETAHHKDLWCNPLDRT